MFDKARTYALVGISVLLASYAGAAVTINTDVHSVIPHKTNPAPGPCHINSAAHSLRMAEPAYPGLAEIANELLSAPSAGTYAPENTTMRAAKSLPPAPTAFLMTLTGFVSVSLIKDKKLWMSALAALLGLSHSGLAALPRCALKVGARGAPPLTKANRPSYHTYLASNRTRPDVEGTQYIGLLYYLSGIPAWPSFLAFINFISPDSTPASLSAAFARARRGLQEASRRVSSLFPLCKHLELATVSAARSCIPLSVLEHPVCGPTHAELAAVGNVVLRLQTNPISYTENNK